MAGTYVTVTAADGGRRRHILAKPQKKGSGPGLARRDDVAGEEGLGVTASSGNLLARQLLA